MKIGHFCSYYVGSLVYRNLFSNLSDLAVESYLYIPIRNKNHYNKNTFSDDNVHFHYVHILGLLTRVSLFWKTFLNVIFSYLYFKHKKLDYIHAHTFYSDGFSAYFVSLLLKLPLLITFRATDCNLGFRFYFHYNLFAKLILNRASSIVFVSHSHKNAFVANFGSHYNSKVKVIPNGIDSVYLDDYLICKSTQTPRFFNDRYKNSTVCTYIGSIDLNKNIKNSVSAFFSLHKNNSIFIIIGGSYDDYVSVYGEITESYKNNVIFLGRLNASQIKNVLYCCNAI